MLLMSRISNENADITGDVLLVGPHDLVSDRCMQLSQEFNFDVNHIASTDDLQSVRPIGRFDLIIVSAASLNYFSCDYATIIKQLVILKKRFPRTFILYVANNIGEEMATQAKKLGAGMVLYEDDVILTSKFDFVVSQTVKSSYIPIKVTDLTVDTTIDFDIYHLLPVRNKFLPLELSQTVLTKDKIDKIKNAVGELYIRGDQVEVFRAYELTTQSILEPYGRERRARSQYVALSSQYHRFLFSLLDRSKYGYVGSSRDLFSRCMHMFQEFITSLMKVDSVHDIVNHSCIGEFGSSERAITVATYGAWFSYLGKIGNISDVITAALLSDLGLFLLNPTITKMIRNNEVGEFKSLQKDDYLRHPSLSLEFASFNGLSLSPRVSAMIKDSHLTRTGRWGDAKIRSMAIETQLIQFCELLDLETVIKPGTERKRNTMRIKDDLVKREFQSKARFTEVFLEKIGQITGNKAA
jgi:hypothetical protein